MARVLFKKFYLLPLVETPNARIIVLSRLGEDKRMASNLIGNEAPLAGVAGSSPVSSALYETGLFRPVFFVLAST